MQLLPGNFQCIICPGITGIQKAVSPFGIIECIVISVHCIGRNKDIISIWIFIKFIINKFHQVSVLIFADHNHFTIVAFFHFAVIGTVHGRFAEPESSFKSGGKLKVGPGRSIQVKPLSPQPIPTYLKSDFWFCVGERDFPLQSWRSFYGHYNICMYTVRININGNFFFSPSSLAEISINGRKYPSAT